MKKRGYRRMPPVIAEAQQAHTREDTLACLGLMALAYKGEPSLPERLELAAQELMKRERG